MDKLIPMDVAQREHQRKRNHVSVSSHQLIYQNTRDDGECDTAHGYREGTQYE